MEINKINNNRGFFRGLLNITQSRESGVVGGEGCGLKRMSFNQNFPDLMLDGALVEYYKSIQPLPPMTFRGPTWRFSDVFKRKRSRNYLR